MALEKSVLTYTIIKDLLKDHYGIIVVSAKKIKLGSANCYCVSDKSRRYFLKEFQSGFKAEDLIRESNLVDFLAKRNIPVARFIKTVSDSAFFVYGEHLICLEEFIEGRTYNYDDLPAELLDEAAQILGKLHQAIQDYPLPEDMGKAWLDSYSADKLVSEYDALIKIALNTPDDKNTARITADLEYKKELAYRCNDYIKYYDEVTYSPTHGDYQGCQLISADGHIKAIIDFSSARRLPITWEIMRSYVQSSVQCRKNAVIDVNGFCKYVREYIKYHPLTETDLSAMAYVYLFQLARSKYGYTQYLTGESEDRESLLEFAFWRTDICREVEKKLNLLSKSLIETAKNYRQS